MKKKVLTTSVLLIALVLSAANAQVIPNVSVRTDKPNYLPGEKGTIYITFHNRKTEPVEIHNITVIYREWQAYIDDKWVGNETIEYENFVVTGKDVGQLNPVEFVVPSDGRAETCYVTIDIATTDGYKSSDVWIYVTQTPYFMEQIITLLTILVVLLIVCTIIIAATIFLSRRRPQVMWRQQPPSETG